MNKDWNYKMMNQVFGNLTPLDIKSIDYKSLLMSIGKLVSGSLSHKDLLNEISRLLIKSLDIYSISIFTNMEHASLSLYHHLRHDHLLLDHEIILSDNIVAYFKERCEANGYLHLESVDEIKEEKVRELLESYEVISLIAIPIFIDGQTEGILSFNSDVIRYWSVDMCRMLHATGIIISQVINNELVQKKLIQECNKFNMAFHSMGEGMIITDIEGRFQTMNQHAREILNIHEEMLGLSFEGVGECYTKEGREAIRSPVEQVLMTKVMCDWGQPFVIKLKNHEKKLLDYCASPIKDSNNQIIGVILLLYDLSENLALNNQIDYLSKYDQITGLYNRAYFEHLIDDLMREELMPISVIIGDVNGLKITNDAYGYIYGDDILRGIGRILHTVTKTKGYPSRWGGDEFVVLLPNSSEEEAISLCCRIKELCHEREHNLTRDSISLGYSVLSEGDFFCSALKEAEDNMNRKKLLESKSLRSHIIKSMQITLQEKSHETEAHASRLSSYCCRIGAVMGLSSKSLYDLELVSVLHDIGKVSISKSILEKPGQLTEEEWREMREHTTSGYRILKSIPELSHIAKDVLYHHERWDGNGYPEGLKNDEIPILSRILAVVDAYDAMTHDRSYRKAMNKHDAVIELMTHANAQFDPNIVRVFVDILENEFKNKNFVNL